VLSPDLSGFLLAKCYVHIKDKYIYIIHCRHNHLSLSCRSFDWNFWVEQTFQPVTEYMLECKMVRVSHMVNMSNLENFMHLICFILTH